jgi:hypothetical protein
LTAKQVAENTNLIESSLAPKPETKDGRWVYQTMVAVANPAGLIAESVAVNWPGKRDSRIQIVPGSRP